MSQLAEHLEAARRAYIAHLGKPTESAARAIYVEHVELVRRIEQRNRERAQP